MQTKQSHKTNVLYLPLSSSIFLLLLISTEQAELAKLEYTNLKNIGDSLKAITDMFIEDYSNSFRYFIACFSILNNMLQSALVSNWFSHKSAFYLDLPIQWHRVLTFPLR